MKSLRLRMLERDLLNADSYTAWKAAAQEHDRETGMADWKEQQTTDLYDHNLVRSRLTQLRDLQQRDDEHGLLYTLNEGIHGNLGGMGKPLLYRQSLFGTKRLINEYIDEVVKALDRVASADCKNISFAEKLDFFRRASHCFGRSALMLSGGATQGMFHMGVCKALHEERLLPSIISGSSAGSVVAGILGTHSDKQLDSVLTGEQLRMEAMKFTGWTGLLKGVPLMDGTHLASALGEYVPNLTFEEAYNLSKRKINISISPQDPKQESRMLNAITSPNVYVQKGILASCAVPGIFPPITLTAKNRNGEEQPYNPSRLWIDGSLTNDLPAKRLSRLYGVNHYIASQINPHVVPFISEKGSRNSFRGWVADVTLKTSKQLIDGILHMSRQRLDYPYVGFLLTQAHALVSQDYRADIMVYPNYSFSNPMKLFSNLQEEDIARLIREGERATWPKLEMIRNCTRISRTLDGILEQLESREQRALINIDV